MNTPGFGLNEKEASVLLAASLKPEEISGDPVTQHERIGELVRWFVRLANGNANPKWTAAHAMELAYYLATELPGRQLSLGALRMDGFKEGINIDPEQRKMLVRIGQAKDYPEYTNLDGATS